MAAKVGSLFVALTADLKGFTGSFQTGERQVARFATRTTGHLARVESRVKMFQRSLGGLRLGSVLGGLGGVAGVGALAGGFGLAGITNAAKEAASAFDTLAKAARTAGLNSDFFQGLEFAGLEEGVNGVAEALVKFAARSGEAVIGKGEMVEKLKLLNPELLKNIQLATSQEERIRLVADAVRDATTADQKAAIVKTAFGDSMIGLVRVFEQGSAGIDDFTRRAREMGLVVDRDVLAKSEEMANKLGVAAKVVDVNLKTAFIEVTPFIVQAARAIASVSREINGFLSQFKAVEDRTTEQLKRRLGQLSDLRTSPNERLFTFLANRLTGLPVQNMQELHDEIERIERELAKRSEWPEIPITAPGSLRPRTEEAIAAEKQRDSVASLVTELKFERDQLRRNADDQELYAALKSVGVDRNSSFGVSIEQNIRLLQQERAAVEQAATATDILGTSLHDAFSSTILGGEKVVDVLRRIALRLADAAIQTIAFKLAAGSVGALLGAGVSPGVPGVPGITLASAAVGIGHGGMVAGQPSRIRMMPVGSHIGAPRMHEGLTSREYKAILEEGEHVLTRDLMNRTAGTIAGLTKAAANDNTTVNVGGFELHIHEAPGTNAVVKQSRGRNGPRIDVEIKRNIDDLFSDLIMDGGSKSNAALERRYALDRTRGMAA